MNCTTAQGIPCATQRRIIPKPLEDFPFPAPVPSGSSLLSFFNGTSPNGTWSLYVFDDLGGDIGSIDGGWDLTITDGAITGVIPEPTTALLLGAGLIALVAARARREPRC